MFTINQNRCKNMGHDKALNDGKKKRVASMDIKEKRALKKLRHEQQAHSRNKPRWKKAVEA